MAHFSVLVICPLGTTFEDHDRAVHGLLEPFDVDLETAWTPPKAAGDGGYSFNPRGEWDRWTIGGRWSGYFPLAPGLAASELEEVVKTDDEGRCVDGGPLRCLGIEELRAAAATDALERWDRVYASFTRPPSPPVLWDCTRDEWERIARVEAVPTYATVLADGSWCDSSDLGPLARPGDPRPPGRRRYVERVSALLDDLPRDTFVVVVDCHI